APPRGLPGRAPRARRADGGAPVTARRAGLVTTLPLVAPRHLLPPQHVEDPIGGPDRTDLVDVASRAVGDARPLGGDRGRSGRGRRRGRLRPGGGGPPCGGGGGRPRAAPGSRESGGRG